MNANDNTSLIVRDLAVQFHTYKSIVNAVQGVSLDIQKGETLGLVGESGCGKSVTASSIMRLVPCPPGEIVSGEILFEGRNILEKSENEMRQIRGGAISMIFQDPMTALNPVFTIGDQITTIIRTHSKASKKEAVDRALEMFTLVGLADPESVLDKYPHEMSGGMCQRAMIGMALSCRPRLLIADEPTTALDVTVQAQILQLMRELKEKSGTSILLITHDLGIIASMCKNVAVMYAGWVVEYGSIQQIFNNPKHPYTKGLLSSSPKIGESRKRLEAIEGNVPDLTNLPPGCLFNPRCTYARPVCRTQVPESIEVEKGHYTSCHL